MGDVQPSLGQLIWLVRRELEWARQMDEDQPLRFEVGTVELDVVVEATHTTAGQGGLDLKVLGVGGSSGVSHERALAGTTTVHVVLTPQDTRAGAGRYQISGRDAEPPPRRAETSTHGQGSTSGSSSEGGGAVDVEPPPRRVTPGT